MFAIFLNAWKVKDIRKKLLYVFLMLAIYRLGCTLVGIPGLDITSLMAQSGAGTEPSLFSLIMGGGIGKVFYMGIGPYINASIIMQLLTVAIPKLEALQKDSEDGRKKINQYTRIVAVCLAVLQASGTVYSMHNFFFHPNWFVWIVAVLSLVTGTIFVMWMSELLTEKGIGNGSSFIIFANILSSLPAGVTMMWNMVEGNGVQGAITVAVILVVFVAIIGFVVLVQDGERRIPVQYSRKMVGRNQYGGQSSYIPIKVNIAGVMSIIFAISLLQFPQTIQQFVPGAAWLDSVVKFLSINTYQGAALYVILIFCFTFFYTSFAINPIEMAENMKKNGGFVMGIRPGKPTSDYIDRTVKRLSWVGALVYSIVALVPIVIQWITKQNVGIGGTTMLIVVGVALEIVKQLESQLLMKNYKGFL